MIKINYNISSWDNFYLAKYFSSRVTILVDGDI